MQIALHPAAADHLRRIALLACGLPRAWITDRLHETSLSETRPVPSPFRFRCMILRLATRRTRFRKLTKSDFNEEQRSPFFSGRRSGNPALD